jgi:hypothetical protein
MNFSLFTKSVWLLAKVLYTGVYMLHMATQCIIMKTSSNDSWGREQGPSEKRFSKKIGERVNTAGVLTGERTTEDLL